MRQVLKPLVNHLWYNPMAAIRSRQQETRQGVYALKRQNEAV
jgi:hypothetical protein